MAADVISQGYAKYKGTNSLAVWKKRWIVFRRASASGPTRIEQFEDEDAAQQHLLDGLNHRSDTQQRQQRDFAPPNNDQLIIGNNQNDHHSSSTEDLSRQRVPEQPQMLQQAQSPAPLVAHGHQLPLPYGGADKLDDTIGHHYHAHHHHVHHHYHAHHHAANQQQQQMDCNSTTPGGNSSSTNNNSVTVSSSKIKTCPLINVLTIERLANVKYALVIKFHDGSSSTKLKYAFSSNMEAECWLRLLIQECLPSTPPVVMSDEPDLVVPGIRKELRERFRVYMMPTTKLEFFGDCLLQVTHENIYLWDIVNANQKIAYWPLTALRRYGSDQNKFTFEAGRHCMTGEGRFDFHTFEGEKIYRKVHQATLAIAHVKTKTMSDTARLTKQQQQQQNHQQSNTLGVPVSSITQSKPTNCTNGGNDQNNNTSITASNEAIRNQWDLTIGRKPTMPTLVTPTTPTTPTMTTMPTNLMANEELVIAEKPIDVKVSAQFESVHVPLLVHKTQEKAFGSEYEEDESDEDDSDERLLISQHDDDEDNASVHKKPSKLCTSRQQLNMIHQECPDSPSIKSTSSMYAYAIPPPIRPRTSKCLTANHHNIIV